ncbi:SIR2 family protein [Tabrizicola sp.]|uniref:SIR2 family protein n=1 Tax=Tabrizicola sp. TaxID=2005166 RepID=UPI003F2E40CF
MQRLFDALQLSRNGNALLFCGAGFTADCLNFDDDGPVGVTRHLLLLLNSTLHDEGLSSGYKDIRNAAKKFRTELGNYRLMQLLKDRFKISRVSSSISDLLAFPWAQIYTTNYDNGIEVGLQQISKKFQPVNNTDKRPADSKSLQVVHLHGFIESWTTENFESSCILDSDSYRSLTSVKKWLEELRVDIERAQAVVFVGFSANDFHLSQVLFNVTELKEKAFFINRPASEPDPDERAVQEEFGTPLYIGRDGLFEIVSSALKSDAPREPRLASFHRYHSPRPSASVPPVGDIEDLFIWGRLSPEHFKRDHNEAKSDYHVLRRDVSTITEAFSSPGKSILLHGDICDGKTFIARGVADRLYGSRPIFNLQHPYDDLLGEVASIQSIYPNAVLIVENCFSIREDRLLGLARMWASGEGNLLLTARSISTEAESGKLRSLRSIENLGEMSVGRLVDDETISLVALIDQIAGWTKLKVLSPNDRRRFIENDCGGIVPSVLLRLLSSEYVRDRYREEFNKTSDLDPLSRRMILAALIIANIGFDAPVSFLSNTFEEDFSGVVRRANQFNGDLKLVRVDGNVAKTVPSIGARNLLKNIVPDKEVVDTTIFVLERMGSEVRRGDFQQHIFSQLMRYSILSSAVSDTSEINRFFDHISKIGYFRDMPLFWLQWHMAMCAQERWNDADKYLSMGYTAADAYEKKKQETFNRKQLDDRRAKFLAARAIASMRSGSELFRDIKESLDIAGRLLRDSELTYHPFETLLDIGRLFVARGSTLIEAQREILLAQLVGAGSQGRKRVSSVPEGYQQSHAKAALHEFDLLTKGGH